MSSQVGEISTTRLAQVHADPACQLIDARPSAAYNGWALHGEPRGGHVPGARSLPVGWTEYIDWIDVLEQKGLVSDRPVIAYAESREAAQRMAARLGELGFEHIEVYGRFTEEWTTDSRYPLERLPRHRQLVHPGWVAQVAAGGPPPEPGLRKCVIAHAHFDNEVDYLQGHIPGAVSLDTNRLESTKTWDRRSPEELEETLLGLGIRRDTTVVVYGRFSFPRNEHEDPGKSAGHLGAMRCAAILLSAGAEDVRVLDGGILSWETAGHPVSTDRVEPEPVDGFGAGIPGHPEYMIDTPDAKALLDAADGELVSVRSWEEFIGERSGYHYIEKKGRIPGAVFGDCGSDAYHMENYRNLDHTVREAREVAARWAACGIVPDKRIAFYCGTGWRGSEVFLNAYLMGWPRIAVYDGGWLAWSSDPANPIATGTPPG